MVIFIKETTHASQHITQYCISPCYKWRRYVCFFTALTIIAFHTIYLILDTGMIAMNLMNIE